MRRSPLPTNYPVNCDGSPVHAAAMCCLGFDEDISIKNIILGKPSGESQKSFQRWLERTGKISDSESALNIFPSLLCWDFVCVEAVSTANHLHLR